VSRNKRHGFVGYVSFVGLVGFLNRLTDLTDLTVITGLTLLLAVSAHAATIPAANCSLSTVQSAISSAQAGDTVTVPACAATWTAQLIISKGITLQGAGIGSTVITSNCCGSRNGMILYSPASPELDQPFELAGFEINGANASGALEVTNGNGGATPITKVKIHDNKFRNCATPAINVNMAYGVVYNNQFLDNSLDLSSNFPESDGWMAPYAAGSAQNMYFEDNTFNYTGSSAFLFETGHGGRMAFRHNTVTNYPDFDMFDSHGNQAKPSVDDWRANRGVEIYHNTLGMKRPAAGHARAWYHRGGEGMMFNNAFSKTGAETGMDINLTEEDGWRTDWGCPCGPPGFDTVFNTYIWNNTFAGTELATSFESASDSNYITQNVQYWLPAKGLEANRPATCADNSFYGTTDTDKLFKCHPANTWTLQYQPYTYPHPLRASAQTASLANLWVDTNGGTCVRSASPAVYNDATACASMQAAQTAASAGDTVILKNGIYPNQSLTSAQKSGVVNYFAEVPGQAKVASLQIQIDRIHVTGVIASGTGDGRGYLDIEETGTEFTDVVIDQFAGSYGFVAASNVTVKNSEFGNANVCNMADPGVEDAFRFWGRGVVWTTTHNDKLLNSVIHDWRGPNECGQGLHIDGMQLMGGDGLVIDGNRFYNNETSDIQQGLWGNVTLGSMLVQNNYFGPPLTWGNVLSIGQAPCSGVIIQNNVFDAQAAAVDNAGGCTGSPVQRANLYLGAITNCDVGIAYAGGYNIFPVSGGTTCGTNAKRCAVQWLNGAPSTSNNFDMRLASGDTCARDAGDPANFPLTDSYGTSRPQGPRSDVGAFEVPSGTPASSSCDLNSDSTTNVADVQQSINQAIGTTVCATGDINNDGTCTVVDVQRDVNAALGGPCVTQ
jgi:hypothetical protein